MDTFWSSFTFLSLRFTYCNDIFLFSPPFSHNDTCNVPELSPVLIFSPGHPTPTSFDNHQRMWTSLITLCSCSCETVFALLTLLSLFFLGKIATPDYSFLPYSLFCVFLCYTHHPNVFCVFNGRPQTFQEIQSRRPVLFLSCIGNLWIFLVMGKWKDRIWKVGGQIDRWFDR